VYEIVVRIGDGAEPAGVTVDGRAAEGAGIRLVDDGARHVVAVTRLVGAEQQTAGSP
jgi:hypothetical protein